MSKLIFLMIPYLCPAMLPAAAPFSHSQFDEVLQYYVNDEGLVRYAALSKNRVQLDAYIDSLARYSPVSHPQRFASSAHSLAYWINAYNAYVIKGIVDAYPIASVKDAFHFSGFFNRQKFIAGGRELTLDDIENGIIRPEFRDPRIHFAVNCGALSCPQLDNRAYTGENLNPRLARALKRFARNPKHVKLQGTQLILSKLLDWYGNDFTEWFPPGLANPDHRPTIANYLLPHLPTDTASKLQRAKKIKLSYFAYDWALNELKEKGHPNFKEDAPETTH